MALHCGAMIGQLTPTSRKMATHDLLIQSVGVPNYLVFDA